MKTSTAVKVPLAILQGYSSNRTATGIAAYRPHKETKSAVREMLTPPPPSSTFLILLPPLASCSAVAHPDV